MLRGSGLTYLRMPCDIGYDRVSSVFLHKLTVCGDSALHKGTENDVIITVLCSELQH